MIDVLAGIRVLDLGTWRPAPFAGQLLAELGATVTKVEPPGGDPMRAFPSLYRSLNEHKEVLELDLKDEAGRSRVLDLVREADVLLEGFRPGVAERLGIGPAAAGTANPGLVYCSVSGFGQDGPLRDLPGHDLNYQAWAGLLAARGPEIHHPGVPVADLAGGSYAALAICAALVARERTGRGRYLDVSMADVLLTWAGPTVDGTLAEGDDPAAGFPAYGTFACAGGALTLGVVSEQPFWIALCDVLGLADLADLSMEERVARGAGLRTAIAAALEPLDRDDVVAALVAAGVPVAPVLSAEEAVRSDVFVERGISRPTPDGAAVLGHPVRFTPWEGDPFEAVSDRSR